MCIYFMQNSTFKGISKNYQNGVVQLLILTRAPLRISLMGGGSDLPAFYEKDYGEVFSFTINKYVYLAMSKPFNNEIRLSYSRTEIVSEAGQIIHPLFRESLLEIGPHENIEIGSFADVPSSGTGLGSSSSFTVALVAGLTRFQERELSPRQIAELACKIELTRCGDPIGKQDQYSSAMGGFNRFRFGSDGSVRITPIEVTSESRMNLIHGFFLIYLGFGRSPNQILETQTFNLQKSKLAIENTRLIRDMVDETITSTLNSDLKGLGRLLDKAWELKKQLSPGISTERIDNCYEKFKNWGAIGGKLLGAGGGGFLFMVVPEENQENFKSELSKSSFRVLPIDFDFDGVKVQGF